MKPALYLLLFLTGASAAFAQPVVSAVVNAASNAVPGLPNAAIAEGSMFVAYGTGLGPSAIVQAKSFPLPTSAGLGGTSAQITVNGSTVNAIMVYTLATQIAAVAPSSTPVGTGTITVTYNGQTSAPAPITIVKSNFGTFAVNQAGSGPGIVTFADYSLVGISKAANPGETLLIWGTGLGPVSGDEAAGPLPGDQPSIPVQVYVGGQIAPLAYRGRSGCCTGLDQIAFVVPQGVLGCSVPVAIQINDQVSNFTTMSVAATGRVCSDASSGLTATDYQVLLGKSSLAIGGVTLSRTNTETTGFAGAGGGTSKEDTGSASFFRLSTPSGAVYSSFLQSTSFGACTVTTFSGQNSSPFPNVTFQTLDAGPAINISGPSGSRTLDKSSAGGNTIYDATLGDTTPGNYLDPGTYTVAGSGGADIGAFTAHITVPPALVWSNEDAVTSVTRAAGQPITWTGGDPAGYVEITGSNFAFVGTGAVGATFTCHVKTSAGSFTVPPIVLLSLPGASSLSGITIPGSLSVSTFTNPVKVTIPGLDFAYVSSTVDNSKQVSYK